MLALRLRDRKKRGERGNKWSKEGGEERGEKERYRGSRKQKVKERETRQ